MSLHHMLRAAAGYQAPAPATTDPQFNYVSLLLHGDGTNGAQNNTFIDSSTNNFTITRNGNTTQGSLSPYGNLWSNFFDGTSDYLTFNASSSAAFGTGAFTVEGWFYLANTTGTKSVLDCRPTQTAVPWGFEFAGGAPSWYNGSSNTSSTSVTANTWNHVAVVREGTGTNQTKIYVNGAVGLTYTDATNYGTMNTAARIGGGLSNVNWFFGNISNLRIVKGTAVYTSAFTPPTAPLTAITNTSLLTCQSNRFIDNSANNFTITRNGDVRVTKESPFLPTAAYSTSTIGGSGYFDGTDDFLQTPTSTALNFNSVDYTAEAWVYLDMSTYTSFDSGGRGIVSDYLVNINNGRWLLYVDTAGKLVAAEQDAGGVSSVAVTDSQNMPLRQWVHVAICKSGTTLYLFKNGALVGTTTSAVRTTFGGRINVGQLTVDTNYRGYFQGFISNVRLVKGTALYTSSFTPPTAPVTAITNTSLLLNFSNAGIFDNAAENDMETVGNAQISTSVKKYGTGSIAFDGTGDWLQLAPGQNLEMGSGDFTWEFWVYPNSVASSAHMLAQQTQDVTIQFDNTSSDQLIVWDGSKRIIGAVSTSQWTHVALVRSSGTLKVYLNGVASGSSWTNTSAVRFTLSSGLIGSRWGGTNSFNGYIDDLRITKGYARYTANFTPPTAAFPDQ